MTGLTENTSSVYYNTEAEKALWASFWKTTNT